MFRPGWDLIVVPDRHGALRRHALWDAANGLDRYEAATVEDVVNDPLWRPVDEVTRKRWERAARARTRAEPGHLDEAA